MSQPPSYERIVTSLGNACRDAAEIGDHEIETKLRDLQTIVINRLYDMLDGIPPKRSSLVPPRHFFRKRH